MAAQTQVSYLPGCIVSTGDFWLGRLCCSVTTGSRHIYGASNNESHYTVLRELVLVLGLGLGLI